MRTYFDAVDEKTENLFVEFVRKHQLAVEALTEKQLVEAIRQAIASGDFQRNLVQDSSAQCVTYIPWREAERLRTLYNDLLYAVVCKFEGETRHETALRYIRDRENDRSVEMEKSKNP